MCCDTLCHLSVGCHEQTPQRFIGCEVRQPVLQDKSRLNQVQWMKEYACYGSCQEVSHKRVPLEDVISKVKVALYIVSEYLVEEHMSASDTIAFVEAKHSLSIESLNAFHVVTIDRSSVRLVQTYIKRSNGLQFYQLSQRLSSNQLDLLELS